jgi:phosphoribosylformylglycinamidine synthase
MKLRFEIASKVSDTRALVKKKKLEDIGYKGKLKDVCLIDVYTVNKSLDSRYAQRVALMLINPITQSFFVNKSYTPKKFTWAIEVGYLPGVTDNVATTTKEIIEDLLKIKFDKKENVYTSQVTFLTGSLSKEDIEMIANSLYNPVIQRAKIKSYLQFIKEKGMGIEIPQVKLDQSKKVDIVNLDVTNEELINIGKSGIENKDGTKRGPLALDFVFMKTIQKYFKKLGRNPTDIELESIAQTWSEHCKHTIFADPIDEIKNGLFNTYIKAATDKIKSTKGRFCVSVFTDNSGAIKFDNEYLITHKVETHNSPSALDPFGGSITGIVGVNRDAIGFGMGAKPIINFYGFCFADPDDNSPIYKGKNFTQKMLSPRRIMDGVIEGVNSGGNCSGIPTPQGFVMFDKRYKGKPLVFVGTVGLIPKKNNGKKMHLKKALHGDYIVMVGGRVGLDGIHGATFSSEAMDSGSPATAVQIGDPITQKKLSDAIIKEARDMDLYNSITDNGAGGLSCSVAEMAKESGGCVVKLDDVPLKYPGLAPWQIWISESQERMTLAVPKIKWKKFYDLMKRRGVEATVIGKFTSSGKCIVKYHDDIAMNVDMKFLHDGLPKRKMKTIFTQPHYVEPNITVPRNLTKTVLQMLKRNNITSFEFISMQYDHEVQGGSVLKPLQGKGRVNADATVTKPLLPSNKGIVLSQGICPNYSNINTYYMAACAIDTAIRNAVAAGADLDHLALLDNFCWCSSNDPKRLEQLKHAVKACYDYAIAYKTPFISGKDSMFNDFKGYDEKGNPIKISIPPTLLISSIGVVNDVSKTVSIDVKFPGDLIYILGETYDELGASEYYSMHGYIGNNVPKVNAKKNKKIYQILTRCINQEIISSVISVNRGGLAVALIKTAMAGMLGINISLKNLSGKTSRDDFALFSESQGRIIVSINPKNKKQFEKIMKGSVCKQIGKVINTDMIRIKGKDNKLIVNLKLQSALKTYKSTFKEY